MIVIAIVLGRRNDDNAAAAVRMGVEDTRQRIHGRTVQSAAAVDRLAICVL